ncbi:unnamed protein product, partial [marine sediment metagenome]
MELTKACKDAWFLVNTNTGTVLDMFVGAKRPQITNMEPMKNSQQTQERQSAFESEQQQRILMEQQQQRAFITMQQYQ